MYNTDYELVLKEVAPLVEEMGLNLVELKVGRTKNKEEISVVIYTDGGVNLNQCAELSRKISPRLDLLEEFQNPSLRVMSPGIDRVIRHPREYGIYRNKGIGITTRDNEHIKGIIREADERKVVIEKDGNRKEINIEDIKKAKLDYKQEVD